MFRSSSTPTQNLSESFQTTIPLEEGMRPIGVANDNDPAVTTSVKKTRENIDIIFCDDEDRCCNGSVRVVQRSTVYKGFMFCQG